MPLLVNRIMKIVRYTPTWASVGFVAVRIAALASLFSLTARAKIWDVTIQNFAFDPAQLTITAGDTVRWTQKDSVTHTTTSGPNGVEDGLWNSGNMTLAANTVFSFTFTNAGAYPYFCQPHRSFMRGTVTVEAASSGLSVQITSPTNNATFAEPATFDLVAEPTPGSDPIAQVEFYQGTNLIATLMAAPWTTTVSNLAAGDYTFTAEVADSAGAESASAPVQVTVGGSTPPMFTGFSASGLGLSLEWEGGTPPYLIQKKTSLSDTNWIDVVTTDDTSTVIARDTDAAFVRVQSGATQVVMPFTVWMNGAAEKPDPVNTTASAFGTLSMVGDSLVVRVHFSGLSGNASAAHIHGPAFTTNAVGVMVPLTVPAATEGMIEGTYDLSGLTGEQRTAIMEGHTYMNIHTPDHPGGEIRGQVAPVLLEANLTGDAERPDPATTTATGYADLWIIGNELTYDLDYLDLSAAATAGHLHGPADAETATGVLVPFVPEGDLGTSGAFSGTATLTQDQLGYLLDGLTYVNVHTPAHPGGEIRGQVGP